MRRYALSAVFVLCLLPAAITFTTSGQTIDSVDGRVGLPWDWSHRHVIFPTPETEQLRRRLDADPRFAHQHLYRTMPQYAPGDLSSAIRGAGLHANDEVTISGATRDWNQAVGAAAITLSSPTYPAKYSFSVTSTTPSCANDYVVYTLPVSSASNFNVIAFNNLYPTFCTGTVPSVLFAYNGSQATGTLSTSPVLSLDGTKIAFVEKASASTQFHVLRWRSGDKSATFPKPYNAAVLPSCVTTAAPAPCEYSLSFSTTTSTLGAPFIDYTNDTAYVTDDKGKLYAIKPVFNATPTSPPALVSGYPITLSTTRLTAPTYDSVSGNVFVADTGKLYYVRTKSTSSGTCLSGSAPCEGTKSITFASGSGLSTILEAPIVDSTNGTVFVFAYSGPAYTFASHAYNGDIVLQSNTTLSVTNIANLSGTSGNSTASTIYNGTFDNAYYNNAANGKIYACGENNSGHTGTLWAVGFASATAIKTGAAGFGPLTLTTASLTGAASPCSSLTEAYNTPAGKDFLYMGVASKCAFSGSATGCIMAFSLGSSLTSSTFPTTTAATFPSNSGSSGIIIDNVLSGTANTTNIYFLTAQPQSGSSPCTVYTGGANTTGNCAIKLTQSGLN